MRTIDVTPQSVGYASKADLASQLGCSISTIKRVIGLLRRAVPDEFGGCDGMTYYNQSQQRMCALVVQLLNGGRGLTYDQIENEYLAEGWPE
ncbi:MAG: hypothetical protein AAGJ95_09520 [Cyanobacteria bacterium J06554_11]